MILPATYQFEVGPPSLPSCHTFPQLPKKHLWPFIARSLCDPYLLLLQSSSWGVCTQKCHQKNRTVEPEPPSESWKLLRRTVSSGMRQVGCTSLAWNNSTPIYFTTSFLICKDCVGDSFQPSACKTASLNFTYCKMEKTLKQFVYQWKDNLKRQCILFQNALLVNKFISSFSEELANVNISKAVSMYKIT